MRIPHSTKSSLRQRYKTMRRQLNAQDQAEWDEKICEYLEHLIFARNITNVLIYHPMPGEPNLLQTIVRNPQINFYLPVIAGPGEMFYARWMTNQPTQCNRYGIHEPSDQSILFRVQNQAPTIVLVPALSFDRQGFRLGYGGGFYDRFIAKNTNLEYIGVTYEVFFEKELPYDTHDQRVNQIITESGIFTARQRQ